MDLETFNKAKELIERKERLANFRKRIEQNPDRLLVLHFTNSGNEDSVSLREPIINGMLAKYIADVEKDIDGLIEKL